MQPLAAHQNQTDEPERDPWFNPYRYLASERSQIALFQIVYDTERSGNRTRRRTPKDKEWFWNVGEALLANLAYHYIDGSRGAGLVVVRAKSELGKQSRYHPPYFTRTFPKILDQFESAGYLTQKKGKSASFQRKRTTVRAGTNLIAVIEKEGLTFEDFGLRDDEEVIILKRRKRGYSDGGAEIEYNDTPLTERLRDAVRDINAWLRNADIQFEPWAHSGPVDVRARRLFRYFAEGSFDKGGRLFRGFWQNLPKRARLSGIRIDGENVTELDYSQLNPMLAYAKVGCSTPSGDAYVIPRFEMHRDGVKKVFNSLLFYTQPRDRFPRGVSGLFPPETKVGDVLAAIHEKHPLLGSVLSTGAGFDLMFLESEIMMDVLKELRIRGIVALPVFDAVIVKSSKREAATAVMKEQFRRRTRLQIRVRAEQALRATSEEFLGL